MTIQTLTPSQILELIETQPIRVLVDMHPRVMPILASVGMDLCCGGGHTVPEAARAHGLEVEPLVDRVAAAILQPRG